MISGLSPTRATIMDQFIRRCGEKGIVVHSSLSVYSEAQHRRPLIRKELKEKGLDDYTIERVLRNAESRFKKLILNRARCQLHDSLPCTKFNSLKAFFMAHQNESNVQDVYLRKLRHKPGAMPYPEDSDIKILAEACELQNPIFVTCDEQIFVLSEGLFKEFGITVISDDTALEALRQWRFI